MLPSPGGATSTRLGECGRVDEANERHVAEPIDDAHAPIGLVKPEERFVWHRQRGGEDRPRNTSVSHDGDRCACMAQANLVARRENAST
jgi:hypothetical protein